LNLLWLTTTTSLKIAEKIKELNEDDNIDGFIVQLPLPEIDEQKKY
jgi:methylenetetrahydrofolate dehydrogenase (NADP+)/methenyltetrahydrofolate cyclohydrolase